jgi:hypothetical protein
MRRIVVIDERLTNRPARIQVETLRKRCRDISKSRARAERFTSPVISYDQRHALARVVRPAECRIVPMISGDDQQIIVAHVPQEIRQPRVKLHQRPGITIGITAMAKEGVEINEIDKHQAALCPVPDLSGLAHSIGIRFGRMHIAETAIGEEVPDLADPVHRDAGFEQRIKYRGWRGH